jgi:hypothetical protein
MVTSFFRQVSGAFQGDCEIPSFLNIAIQGSTVDKTWRKEENAKAEGRGRE